MRTRKPGKAAIVTTGIGILLAAGDYTDLADKLALFFGLPPKNLPLLYIVAFIVALFFLRHEYESADYEFVPDPDNEFLFEPEPNRELHRVTVKNRGHSPINVKVLVTAIEPLPRQFMGKLGMPLVPMGATEETDGSYEISPGNKHAFNAIAYDYSTKYLIFWHAWPIGAPNAMEELPFQQAMSEKSCYRVKFALSPSEGQPKEAEFLLRRQAAPAVNQLDPGARVYRLIPAPKPTWVDRVLQWLEEPVYRVL